MEREAEREGKRRKGKEKGRKGRKEKRGGKRKRGKKDNSSLHHDHKRRQGTQGRGRRVLGPQRRGAVGVAGRPGRGRGPPWLPGVALGARGPRRPRPPRSPSPARQRGRKSPFSVVFAPPFAAGPPPCFSVPQNGSLPPTKWRGSMPGEASCWARNRHSFFQWYLLPQIAHPSPLPLLLPLPFLPLP